MRSRITAVIGLDEVGRGCLAGPVCAAASLWFVREHAPAASLDWDWHPHGLGLLACNDAVTTQRAWLTRVADSKKLSPKRRNEVHVAVTSDPLVHVRPIPADDDGGENYARDRRVKLVRASNIAPCPNAVSMPDLVLSEVAVGAATATEIDERNIWEAVQLAMGRALDSLALVPEAENVLLLVDGSFAIKVPQSMRTSRQWTVVGGDALFPPIALASCVAKFQRDRWMGMLAERYPVYGFERHAGYGTQMHMEAIRANSPCNLHRRSFLGRLLAEMETGGLLDAEGD